MSLSGKTEEVPTPLTTLYIKPPDSFYCQGPMSGEKLEHIVSGSHRPATMPLCRNHALTNSESADMKTAHLDLLC